MSRPHYLSLSLLSIIIGVFFPVCWQYLLSLGTAAHPKYGTAYFNLGVALEKLKRRDEAIAACRPRVCDLAAVAQWHDDGCQ